MKTIKKLFLLRGVFGVLFFLAIPTTVLAIIDPEAKTPLSIGWITFVVFLIFAWVMTGLFLLLVWPKK